MSPAALEAVRKLYAVVTVAEPTITVEMTLPNPEAIAQSVIADEHAARARVAADNAAVTAQSIPVEITATASVRRRGRPPRTSTVAPVGEPIRGEDIAI